MDIRANIEQVKTRMTRAAARAGRDPSQITIVCVTKNRSLADMCAASDAGIACFGESKIQEAEQKFGAFASYAKQHNREISLHLIGHLQTNKVRRALSLFSLIHSVDSLRLARKIDEIATAAQQDVPVLLEVNTSGESQKYGMDPAGVIDNIREISKLSAVRVQGLMTMAPLVDDPEAVRPSFARLRELRDRIQACKDADVRARVSMQTLSMGMSSDFEVAIEEGATMVRIGSAFFEEAA